MEDSVPDSSQHSPAIAAMLAAPRRQPRGRKPGKQQKRMPRIKLPDGDYLEPREKFAAGLGLSDRSMRSLPLSVTYLGGIAYVAHNASMEVVLKAKTRHPPP